jgi:hypothetical protein
VLLLVVGFTILDVDNYFGLVAFQMARPTLYIVWHAIFFIGDCDVHM